MKSRLLRLTVIAAAVLGTLAIPSANAVNVPHNQVVSANPADWTPWVNDGAVYALVQIGNQMYVGGSFTTVQEPNATTFNRAFLFSLNATTGAVNRNFHPTLDGQVNALATDGTNLFVGGAFSTVNGAPAPPPRRARLERRGRLRRSARTSARAPRSTTWCSPTTCSTSAAPSRRSAGRAAATWRRSTRATRSRRRAQRRVHRQPQRRHDAHREARRLAQRRRR